MHIHTLVRMHRHAEIHVHVHKTLIPIRLIHIMHIFINICTLTEVTMHIQKQLDRQVGASYDASESGYSVWRNQMTLYKFVLYLF